MNVENRVFKNASWIVGCKIIQSLLTLVIGMFTARYLGPSNYGLISYAASVVAFFAPIMQLGFSATLVQELINAPRKEGMILGTALVFNILSSIACVLGIVAFCMIANRGETETMIVCLLYSLTLIFQASEMTRYWFQAKLRSKYSSLIALFAYSAVSCYKIYLLIAEKNIRWFALTHVLEAFLIALFLIIIYFKLGGEQLGFSFNLGRAMLSRSKYYIGSAMMVVVFQQTDRIMINVMMSEVETGYYSSALACVGITGFVFSAIIDSARPSILESKKKSEKDFEEKLIGLYSLIAIISLGQSIGMFIFSKILIRLLYGEAFLPAVSILQIAVWFVMFSYLGSVRNIWILSEHKSKHLWYINVIGACLNVFLNFLLIPNWGGRGAATATLITQFFTNVVLGYVIKPIRRNNVLLLQGLHPKRMMLTLVQCLKYLFRIHKNI